MQQHIISKYITLTEATKSQTAVRLGIDNTPNLDQLAAMQTVAEKVFDRVREHFKTRIAVTSFFRCHALNKAIGGATNSQHTSGEAMDIDADVYGVIRNVEVFNYIKDNLQFDQLIWEFGTNENPDWVHVSFTATSFNRNQIFRAVRDGGRTIYKPFR